MEADMPERVLEYSERFSALFEEARPDESLEDLTQINWHDQVAAGRNTLLLDAEGTFVETGAWDVENRIKRTINEAREAGIENIAIITNKRPKYDYDWTRLAWWGREIGADVVFTPLYDGDRKPRPTMVNRALEFFGVSSESALMVGDKASADVRAANAANVHSVWVDRLGQADLAGDRVFRRPLERIWRKMIQSHPKLKQLEKELPNYVIEHEPQSSLKSLPPQDVQDLGIIYGFGVLEHTFPDQGILSEQDKIDEELGIFAEVIQKMDKFMKDHGGLVADSLTLSRVPLALITAGAIMKEKWVLAACCHALAQGTDFFDGKARAYSNESYDSANTKRGGRWDASIDKFYSTVVSLALTLKGRKSFPNFAVQIAREVMREKQRANYRENHPDMRTDATMSGKVSTAAVGASDMLAMLLHRENQRTARELGHTAGSTLKLFSLKQSEKVWHRRHEDKQIAKQKLEILQSVPD